MNNETRKQIDAIIAKISHYCDADAITGNVEDIQKVFKEVQSDAESLGDDEQQKFDDAPESLKDSERIQKFQEAADLLLDAANKASDVGELTLADCDNDMEDYLSTLVDKVQEIIDDLASAKSV